MISYISENYDNNVRTVVVNDRNFLSTEHSAEVSDG